MQRIILYVKAFVAFCLFLFSSCGLETYYYLEEPRAINNPNISSDDKTTNYFTLQTNETGNSDYINNNGEFSFLGTEVYYKIYKYKNRMSSVESTISTRNESSDITSAASYLSEHYSKLICYENGKKSGTILDPLLPPSGNGVNRYVYIRLNSYQNLVSAVKISDSIINSCSEEERDYISCRDIGGKTYGFDFSTDDSQRYENPVPAEGDSDVDYTGTASDDEEETDWYVDLYAVSSGRDTSYSMSYSKVVHLGAVRISTKDYSS